MFDGTIQYTSKNSGKDNIIPYPLKNDKDKISYFSVIPTVIQPLSGTEPQPLGMMAAAGTAATPSLSTILHHGFDNLALNIATYLSAQDVLSLHNVNRSWHNVLNNHEELLFEHLLCHDFVEGEVLNYVAKRDNLSRKKLHLAFHKRWSLPKQGDEKTRICITWTRPDIPQNVYAGKSGINSLVFIARVGDENASNSCALLEWNNPDYDSERRQQRNNEQLIIDKR